jgi:hypothetical protein
MTPWGCLLLYCMGGFENPHILCLFIIYGNIRFLTKFAHFILSNLKHSFNTWGLYSSGRFSPTPLKGGREDN